MSAMLNVVREKGSRVLLHTEKLYSSTVGGGRKKMLWLFGTNTESS